jgi:hypothetical protein
LAEHLRLCVNKCVCRAGDYLRLGTVTDVVEEGLSIGGYEDGHGAIDVLWDDALGEGKRDREGCTASEHLTK